MSAANSKENLIARIKAISLPLEVRQTGVWPRLEPLDHIRAVLFDVYGTLLISGSGDVGTAMESSSEAAMQAALSAADCAPRSDAGPHGVELMRRNIQTRHDRLRVEGIEFPEIDILEIWEEIIHRLTEENLIRAVPSEVDLELLAIEYECRANPVWPMPGFPAILAQLGTKVEALGIVSNAQFFTPLMLEALAGSVGALGFRPDLAVFSYRCRQAKPSPYLFESAVNSLRENYGIAPAETLYVGNDMRNDIQTAVRAGCRTALFAGDARSMRLRGQTIDSLDPRPDLIVTDLRQLPQAVSGA